VLLVDDDVQLLHAWRRILRAAGFAVEILEDSLALPALLRGETFEAVITDIRMTGLDGFGVLRAVREAAPEVPVVLATGSADLRTAIQAVEAGAFRYLQKPVGSKELAETIGEAVRMHRIARAREEAFRVVGEEAVQARARARLELSEVFDRALEQRFMAYQPMCDRRTGEPWAYEALLRTGEPRLARPVDFLGAAEELDRLVDIGRGVRNDVAFALAQVPEGRSLFVNLHPVDLEDDDLYDAAAPLACVASRVVLEITERASLADVPDLASRLARLRALGFRIAVDDLGAGFAGLASFARLRPEVVKIDMSLVRGVESDPVRQKLVDSITHASHDLGILVVAEGIESPAERDVLAALEVDLLQGYLFGRPERAFAP
jgi:EAL domain-containing protein (putative c-di-GMP-specific phosphodiesterase class I)/CheY-like chemotaxis protein